MNRRTFLKRMAGSTLVTLGIGGGTYYYAHEIEPFMLDTHEETISSKHLPSDFNDFKILQFSDTHIDFQYDLKDFSKLVKQMNNLTPDLIVFTGDLVDDLDGFSKTNHLTQMLDRLKAPFGKYWIYGNHDHGGYGTDIVKKMMADAGFQLLKNSHASIEKNDTSFTIAGIDDTILGRPDIEKAIDGVHPDLFTLLLAHEPDYADTTKHYPVDVQLSGHSHGGQVRLPLIGHLYTPVDAKKYIKGQYHFSSSNLTLFVSKGVGTTRMPYRFLCRPEFHLYTLKHHS